jgi:hypothetical protein
MLFCYNHQSLSLCLIDSLNLGNRLAARACMCEIDSDIDRSWLLLLVLTNVQLDILSSVNLGQHPELIQLKSHVRCVSERERERELQYRTPWY